MRVVSWLGPLNAMIFRGLAVPLNDATAAGGEGCLGLVA